jgi:hypothetical protein
MSELTWTCHICHEERPDRFISVLTKPLNIPGVDAQENIRYCNDKRSCLAGAQVFRHFESPKPEPEPEPSGLSRRERIIVWIIAIWLVLGIFALIFRDYLPDILVP